MGIFLFSCNSDDNNSIRDSFIKPKGIYASSFGNETTLDNNQVKGSLIRVKWDDIESNEGIYDFSSIEQFREIIKARFKCVSLQYSIWLLIPNRYVGK